MPNDAKMGLVAGVAIVLLIAALFFRKDSQAEPNAASEPALSGNSTIPGLSRPAAENTLPPPPSGSPTIPGASPPSSGTPALPGASPPAEADLPPAALPEVPRAGAG